ncbi:MAG: hypothetical protein C4516_09055 [Oxalobacter sp.]|nr:MAG: hypothetical protein C4516_09055 [Oxalobacter sp.]
MNIEFVVYAEREDYILAEVVGTVDIGEYENVGTIVTVEGRRYVNEIHWSSNPYFNLSEDMFEKLGTDESFDKIHGDAFTNCGLEGTNAVQKIKANPDAEQSFPVYRCEMEVIVEKVFG